MSAATAVLSEALAEAIDGRKVVAAVFTSFTFDPEFFELQVLPVLFDEAFSQVDKVRRVQLEECLRGVEEIAVYYDRTGLVGDARPAALDFRRIDVRRRNGVFHPKVALVLVENPPEEEDLEPTRSLVVAVLSANLSRSGWWENLEAGHVEVIDTARRSRVKCTFRADLLRLIGSVRRSCGADEQHHALDLIQDFLRRDAPRREVSQSSHDGALYTRLFVGQKPLAEWLRELRMQRWEWNLEVISPYFDAHGATALVGLVEALKPREVRVLLPGDLDGVAVLTPEQFEAVAAHAKWGRLPAGVAHAETASGKSAPRRVHAKVYRFWTRDGGEVVLVGSVNLTRVAHSRDTSGNLEAAFLVDQAEQRNPRQWWLQPLDAEPTAFQEIALAEESDAERVLVDISVRYDWSRDALEVRVDSDHEGGLCLSSLAGEELVVFDRLDAGAWLLCDAEAARALRELLPSTSFLQASVEAGAWRVLVREEGMTHKPALLLSLTPEEILQYWSLLTPAQRQAFIIERLELGTDLEGLRVRIRRVGRIETLFDRFAGIYHAFEHLARWVDERLEEGRPRAAVARMFGEAYDSLPVLLRKTLAREDADAVLQYVTFLSALQLRARVAADWPEFWAEHPEDTARLDALLARLDDLRDALPLEGADRAAFLEWYELIFLTPAAELEGEES